MSAKDRFPGLRPANSEIAHAEETAALGRLTLTVNGWRKRLSLRTSDNIPHITLRNGQVVKPFLTGEGHYDVLAEKGVHLYYQLEGAEPILAATFVKSSVKGPNGKELQGEKLQKVREVLDFMSTHFMEAAQEGARRAMAEGSFPSFGD